MGNLKDFSHALTHWSFGITILVGLVASEFTGAEAILAIFVAAAASTLSALCVSPWLSESAIQANCDRANRRRPSTLLPFLVLWSDALAQLCAAATAARSASATVDYVTGGRFRRYLFGLEQHSLGEPWPDVLGVAVVVCVAVMFMMGLEKSPTISALLLVALLGNFAFFATIGSFHTVIKFWKWCERLRVLSYHRVITAATSCTFAFVHYIPITQKNNCLKFSTMVLNPLVFYSVTTVVFSMMTRYRELVGTAIPLIQVFESRDVDWARPIIAAFTITVVCLALTEVLPVIYNTFVRLASKEWRVFVPSIQYQSSISGAPILAIFAAGSLAAILAFACPLSHLIKLLNASVLMKCIFICCQMVYNRYKPEINYDCLVYNTNVQYSKLAKDSRPNVTYHQPRLSIKDRIKAFFISSPAYVHRLSSPNNVARNLVSSKTEEKECLLLDDYSNKSLNIDMAEDSGSDNEDEDDLDICSESDSTDIDVVVQEYQEGLKLIATVEKFTPTKPATKLTSIVVIFCLLLVITASATLCLYMLRIIDMSWPSFLGLGLSIIIIMGMPQNASDKSKQSFLPSFLFPFCQVTCIAFNMVLISTVVVEIWQGLVFWTLAGLLLFWRCDCCTCDGLMKSTRMTTKVNPVSNLPETESKEVVVPETIFITR
nr:unnamed protein product [Callosobruchus chinensis]